MHLAKTPQHMKEKLTVVKANINSSVQQLIGNFDIPLSIVDKTRQKISKYIENLNRIQPT